MYTNKQVMSTYALYPTYLMVSQAIVLLAYLFLFRRDKIYLRVTKPIVGLALLNTSNVFFGLLGSAHMSVAVFTALRRVSIGLTLLGEILYLKRKRSKRRGDVGLMMAAVAIVAIDDTAATFRGYTFVMVNNVLTAAAQLLSKQLLDASTSKETVMVVVNASTVIFGTLLSVGKPLEMSVPGWGFGLHRPC